MARPRNRNNRELPMNLYYSKDTKAYRYKDTIKNKWHNFGLDRQKAIKSAQILNAKLMTNTDLIAGVMAEHTLTLKQFIDDYRAKVLPEKKLRKATLDLYQIRHRLIANALGDKPLNMLNLTQVSDFLAGLSPRASNQTRACLIDLLNHAVARGLVETNVAAKTIKRNDEKQRKRHTKEGIKAIREHAPHWLKNAIDLALLISQRRCDLLNLRFDGIKDGYMYVIQQKTSDQTDASWLKMEITPAFQKVIDQCRDEVESPFLIHRQPDRMRDCENKEHPTQITGHYLSTEFRKARNAAKCYPEFSAKEMPGLHEIRGTSLKMYQMAGKDAQKIAGHATPDMTLNYLKGHEFAEWVEVSPDLDISEFTEG
ncbi:tyrosine-type recombinase/integrase [Ectopseudomonas oleovorans]|uniref:tyrosine-type recombinase/integrase n=1 Tax=Ectopseudomonas oleovorans TaxID=301 RepID=UPI000CF0A633|nr:phage integrase Arm DNA-binding domain-containing protein [Pseudomonas oleovorans]PPV41346.1 integrase [Pseudomonas oleovorans]